MFGKFQHWVLTNIRRFNFNQTVMLFKLQQGISQMNIYRWGFNLWLEKHCDKICLLSYILGMLFLAGLKTFMTPHACDGAQSSLCNACYLISSWKREPDLRERSSSMNTGSQNIVTSLHPNTTCAVRTTHTVKSWDFILSGYLNMCALPFSSHVCTFWLVVAFVSVKESQL